MKELFSFTQGEKTGIVVLLILIFIELIYLFATPKWNRDIKTDFGKFDSEIAKFESSLVFKDSIVDEKKSDNFENLALFKFNPNNLSELESQKLGFTIKQYKILKNYLNKGGKLKYKEDLKKIYGIDDKFYQILFPFISLPQKKQDFDSLNIKLSLKKNNLSNRDEIVNTELKIELNSADTTSLKKINGIGSKFASRIIKYRDLLGGYSTNEQLLEVYGIKKDLFDRIKFQLHVNLNLIHKININFADLKEMGRHPYIGFKNAKMIVQYRSKNGPFTDLQQLIENNLLTFEDFKKLSYYLQL